MNQWLNREHPQTLQGGIILGYISAVLALIGGSGGRLLGPYLPLFVAIGVFAGAFLSANNKRIGYYVLAVTASLFALEAVHAIIFRGLDDNDLLGRIATVLWYINRAMFPTALVALIVHPQSWNYQKMLFS